MPIVETDRIDTIARGLSLYLASGQVSELRAIGVGTSKARCAYFADCHEMALAALELEEQGAKGIYFTPNPLRPGVLEEGRGPNKGATKEDVTRRAWLLVDADPGQPAKTNATDPEKAAALAVLQRAIQVLRSAGFAGRIVTDSSNGYHAAYPIDLPNDDAATLAIKQTLYGLHVRCSDGALEGPQIDVTVHDAPRIWKVPGVISRKGPHTDDRPQRCSAILWDLCELRTEATATANTLALRRLLEDWERQQAELTAIGETWTYREVREATAVERAALYLEKMRAAIAGQHGSDVCYRAAAVCVESFALTDDEALEAMTAWNARCVPPWSEKELRHKLASARAKIDPSRLGAFLRGEPSRNGAANGHANGKPEKAPEKDATAEDLLRLNSTIRWAWEKWIPPGVLTILAAEPGCGKTRFCADLARRIYLGLPWPDGSPPTFPAGSTTLWVAADNQHPELSTMPAQMGFPPGALFLNATCANPFAGTMLDETDDLKDFEARIKRVKPAMVIIDTCFNATDRTAHKPEDAKAFFKPLQEIAQRCQCVIICVTHLNAAGKPLGRRIEAQGRIVIMLERPDPAQEHRRKVYVRKSFHLMPAPLGVTMDTHGNEYDLNPPETVEDGFGRRDMHPRLKECVDWISGVLKTGPKRVSHLRTEAKSRGYSTQTLYKAKDVGNFEEFEAEGKKYWQVTTNVAE